MACIRGVKRKSAHETPMPSNPRKVAGNWYITWNCKVCKEEWYSDGGRGDKPDYNNERPRHPDNE